MRDKADSKRDMAERQFIEWIRRQRRADRRLVKIGPGDDAALLRVPSSDLLAKVDSIAEGVDFTLETASARQIGRKALAINLSDIAAMGGEPLFCLASVTLRKGLGARFQKDLYRGLAELAEEFSCPLVGGDITGWTGGVVVTVFACGKPAGKKAITRSGARPRDLVLVTGELGGSILGHHLTFTPRLEEAAWLAKHFPPTAMIDISDGLGVDSGHIAEESGVKVQVDAGAVPLSVEACKLSFDDGVSPVDHAVRDGEDFELLFTMREKDVERLVAKWPFETGISVIGRVSKGRGSWLIRDDGKRKRIDSEGYEHFG